MDAKPFEEEKLEVLMERCEIIEFNYVLYAAYICVYIKNPASNI